jgi:hypothetical protein
MTNAGPRVAVETLEGRQLFTATINAAEETGGIDLSPVELALPHAGAAPSVEWSGDDLSVVEAAVPALSLSSGEVVFDEPVGGGMGAICTLTLRNTGAAALTIPSGGLSIVGSHAALFQILAPSAVPTTIAPGASLDVPLIYNPGSGEVLGAKRAELRIRTDDPSEPEVSVPLHGLATGNGRDPLLLRIFCLDSGSPAAIPHAAAA